MLKFCQPAFFIRALDGETDGVDSNGWPMPYQQADCVWEVDTASPGLWSPMH